MKFATTAEQLLFSTVRVETIKGNYKSSGTAFAYHYLVDGGYHVFLVTNRHVIRGASEGRLLFTKSSGVNGEEEPLLGQSAEIHITNFESAWHFHPNPNIDIAILSPFEAFAKLEKSGSRVFLKAIPSDLAMKGESLEDLDAIEPIVFIGYPDGMYDTANLTPIVRTGITATHPALDYGGTKAFLIDASVFHGSSGSPVLLYNVGSYGLKVDGKPSGTAIGNRVAFLGILSTVFSRDEKGKIKTVEIPAAKVSVATIKQMIDLGVVLKAELIDEAIASILAKQVPA